MLFDDAICAGKLTASDLAIVEYITHHPHEVVGMKTRDLAEAAFVSPATVVRFAKKVGFASFNAMLLALTRELADEEAFRHVDSDHPQISGTSAAQVANTISSMQREAIRKTERLLAAVQWEPIMQALEKAKGVSIYALGSSRTPATCRGRM